MGKYEKIIEEVINLCDRVEELEDMKWYYDINTGDIIPRPSPEIDKEERKCLISAYAILFSVKEDVRNDYAELPQYSISFDKEERFIRSAYKLLDLIHAMGIDKSIIELKSYFKPDFNKKWFDAFLVPQLNVKKWSKKDCARISYMIFRSMHGNTHTIGTKFLAWHQKFCEIIRGEYTAEYKPKKLENDLGDIESQFFFLLPLKHKE